jgi:hypothetical protein
MNIGEANALNRLLSILRRHHPLTRDRQELETALRTLMKSAHKALQCGHSPDMAPLVTQQLAGLVRLAENAPQMIVTAPPGTRIVAQDGFTATIGYLAEVLDAVQAIRKDGPTAEIEVRQPDGLVVRRLAVTALCDAIAPQLKITIALEEKTK